MPRLTFIHTADLHLDTPFKGLTAIDQELAESLKQANFQAFENIIDCCLRENVDFLLIGGDIFDGRNRSLTAQLRFAEGLKKLAAAEIPVFCVCGNHDPADSWSDKLRLPDPVHVFSADRPETVPFFKHGRHLADICGISHGTPTVKENLAAGLEKNQDPPPLSVALLHGTIGPAGPHEKYAPFSEKDIQDKGFDYWALGHIHQAAIIRKADPAIVYPGTPQGRDFGESGEKGCYLVTLESGRPPACRFINTQLIGFETRSLDLTGETSYDRLPTAIEEVRQTVRSQTPALSYILRIRLEGRTPLHRQLHEQALTELAFLLNEDEFAGRTFCRLDRIENETLPDIDLDQIAGGSDFPAEIVRTLRHYRNLPEEGAALIRAEAEIFGSYPVKKELPPLTDEDRLEILEKAERWLVDLLFPDTDPS